MSFAKRLFDFFSRKSKVAEGGGEEAIKKQIQMGKMTARDRINAILDKDSFHEYDLFVEHKCTDFNMATNIAMP